MALLVKHWKLFLELGKVRITFAVTLSTITGYVLFAKNFPLEAMLPVLGVFFLSAASSALNQLQEWKYDAMMKRTEKRPIPDGRASFSYVSIYVVLFFLLGSGLLFFFSNTLSMLLGWLTFFWYNAVYTPMKRHTVFAVIVGALIGALPPMIGYTAAGGLWYHPDILIVAFFFFIWQVPHFILLVLRLGDQYEQAGYPSLTEKFSENQIRRIIFIWIIGTIFSAFLLPIFQVISQPLITIALILSSLWLLYSSGSLVKTHLVFKFKPIFLQINLYLLLIMILLVIEALA
jgi:heme o synthase